MMAFRGNTYGITIGVTSVGIVYNKNAFEKAGIATLPTTLEEFYEACERLKQVGIVSVKSEDIGFMPLPVSETGTPNASE